MEILPSPLPPRRVQLAALACLMASTGCTSVISSAYLREAWLDAVEHAADAKSEAHPKNAEKAASRGDREADESEAVGSSSGDTDTNLAPVTAATAWSPATLDEAVDEADRRLEQSGGLNAAARGTLIATLKSTPRQDWPVVVEEFTAALAAAHADAPVETAPVAEPVAPMPPTEAPPAEASSAASAPAAASLPAPETARDEPDPLPLTIQNACFASRVRAWGVIDRFETAEFEPGQEVIVYFELEQLTSRESAEGHTTRIDTVLRLVGGDGRRVHEWTFEPLEETCGSQRRDYFARYLVALPSATPPGPCRLECTVTDTIGGRTAHATLPLSVVAR